MEVRLKLKMSSFRERHGFLLKYSSLFLLTVAFATSVAVFLFHKHAGHVPGNLSLDQRNVRESKTSKDDKKRVEYHAMVAEKLYADNIKGYLK